MTLDFKPPNLNENNVPKWALAWVLVFVVPFVLFLLAVLIYFTVFMWQQVWGLF